MGTKSSGKKAVELNKSRYGDNYDSSVNDEVGLYNGQNETKNRDNKAASENKN